MIRVRRARVVRLVAGVAVRRGAGVAAAHVALRAVRPVVGPGEREPRRLVIEVRGPPGRGRVAALTLRREVGRLVVRVRRGRVVRLVARVAVRRGAGVAAAHVALRAVRPVVGAGQREPCRLVIEVRGPPGRGRVAALALRREVGRLVVRVRRGRVVRLVARVAVRRGAGVAAAHVALRALRPVVGAGEREPRRLVIEVRRAPGARVVAVLALGREARGLVVGVRGAVVVRLVTGGAVRGSPLVLAVGVAARAVHAAVGAGEREARLLVIELGRAPAADRVAVLAGRGEAAGGVVRVRGRGVGGLVARDAGARGPGVVAAGVAAGAGQGRVPAGEREALRVREARAPPRGRRHVVAVLAPTGEPRLDVVGVRGPQVGREVAVAALRGGGLVLVGLLVAVAGRAVEAGVGGEEREARPGVHLEHLALVRPRRRGVAGLAARTHLAPVRVLVAVGAGGPHLVEHQRPVAAAARDLRVGRLQGKPGRVVAELQRLGHRRPSLGDVALCAVEREVAVGLLLRALAVEDEHGNEHQGCGSGGKHRASHRRSPLVGGRLPPWQPRHVVGSGL